MLVADDDGTERLVVTEALEAGGFRVRCAEDGLEALEKVREEAPDLILLDILMPRLDGISTLKQIRAESSDVHLPVIVTTGYDDAHAIRAAYDSGASDFLVKPVPERVLTERVRFALRASSALRALDEARRAAERAEKLKTEFVGNVSHEMRTPLNGVLGLTKMLLEEDLPPATHDGLAMILESTRRLQSTVEDILDFSELELGSLALHEVPFRLSSLLEQLLLRHREGAERSGVTLAVRADEGIPAVLRGDPRRLRQLLDDLVDNALRYADASRIEVSASCRSFDDWVDLTLEIRDDGRGLSADEQALIFRPFTQCDGSMTRRSEGLGLGLSLCGHLARLMKGRLSVESSPQQGSVFQLRVPMHTLSMVTPEAREDAPESERHLSRVLIAEDNAINARMLDNLVGKAGFSTRIVGNGHEALSAFREDPEISIILMDLHMPAMDGFEATRLIRRCGQEEGRSPFIAAVSAHADPAHRRRAFESGVNEFLSKPVDALLLRSLITAAAAESGTLLEPACVTEECP